MGRGTQGTACPTTGLKERTSELRGQDLCELLLKPAFLPATEQHNVCETKHEGQGFERSLVDSRQRFLGKMSTKCERGQRRDLASLQVYVLAL